MSSGAHSSSYESVEADRRSVAERGDSIRTRDAISDSAHLAPASLRLLRASRQRLAVCPPFVSYGHCRWELGAAVAVALLSIFSGETFPQHFLPVAPQRLDSLFVQI